MSQYSHVSIVGLGSPFWGNNCSVKGPFLARQTQGTVRKNCSAVTAVCLSRGTGDHTSPLRRQPTGNFLHFHNYQALAPCSTNYYVLLLQRGAQCRSARWRGGLWTERMCAKLDVRFPSTHCALLSSTLFFSMMRRYAPRTTCSDDRLSDAWLPLHFVHISTVMRRVEITFTRKALCSNTQQTTLILVVKTRNEGNWCHSEIANGKHRAII